MNDFDRRLELELARMLDGVVHAPAPPRGKRSRHRPVVELRAVTRAAFAPAAAIVVLEESPGDLRAEAAVLSEPAGFESPALMS